MKRTFAIWMIISIVAAAPAKAQNHLAYLDKKATHKVAVSPLTNFTVAITQNKPHLYWQTGETADYSHFEIQRSEDGQNFRTVAIFFAKEDAKPRELYDYKDTSAEPNGKPMLYRLRIVNSKGEDAYSDVKKLQVEK